MKFLLVTLCYFFSVELMADRKSKKTLAEATEWWKNASEAQKNQQRELRCGGDEIKIGAECEAQNAELVARNKITPQEAAALNKEGLYADYASVSKSFFVCPCGCFDLQTVIRMAMHEDEAEKGVSDINVGDYVKVLSEDSRLGQMQFIDLMVTKAIYGEEKPLLYQISTDSALEIKLTQHHGVPLENGIMTTAKDLVVGQKLLTEKGTATTITAITRVPATDGLVYNFNTAGSSKEGHLIIANGLLMGDVAWQNELGSEIGAVAIRK